MHAKIPICGCYGIKGSRSGEAVSALAPRRDLLQTLHRLGKTAGATNQQIHTMKHILTLIAITATLALGACASSKPAAGACTKGAKADSCCKTKAGAKKM